MKQLYLYSDLGLGNIFSSRSYKEAYDFCCKFFNLDKLQKAFGMKINEKRIQEIMEEIFGLYKEKERVYKSIIDNNLNIKEDIKKEYKLEVIYIDKEGKEYKYEDIEDKLKKLENLLKEYKGKYIEKGQYIKKGGFIRPYVVGKSGCATVLVDRFGDYSNLNDEDFYILKTVKTIKDKRDVNIDIVKPYLNINITEILKKDFDFIFKFLNDSEISELFYKSIHSSPAIDGVIRILNKKGEIVLEREERLQLLGHDNRRDYLDIAIRDDILGPYEKRIEEKHNELNKEFGPLFEKFYDFLKRHGFFKNKIVGYADDAAVIRLNAYRDGYSGRDKDLTIEEQLVRFVDSLQVDERPKNTGEMQKINIRYGWYLALI